jgi:EEF1A lysine methyltransferase 4
MDAMMTSKGDVWVSSLLKLNSVSLLIVVQNPSVQVIENCTKEISEVLRVLHPKTGVFLYLTFGQPHFRRRYLQREATTLQVRELGDAFHYYLYVLKMTTE